MFRDKTYFQMITNTFVENNMVIFVYTCGILLYTCGT